MSNNEKQKDIIRKLLTQADDEEFRQGNVGTAELFREKANEKMLKYGITLEEIQALIVDANAPVFINAIGKTTINNPFQRLNARTKTRKLWFEELARVIAEGYNCRIKATQTSDVIFYGFDLDREISTFIFLKLAGIADDLCKKEMKVAKDEVGQTKFSIFSKKSSDEPDIWMEDEVFIPNFHLGFREALNENYKNHVSDLNEQKLEEVLKYWNEDYIDNCYSYDNESEDDINKNAYDRGFRMGVNVSKKASSNPSGLVTTKKVALDFNKLVDTTNKTVIVVDTSGSMGYRKDDNSPRRIQQAKDGILQYAKGASEKGYLVGLIEFNSFTHKRVELTDTVNGDFTTAIDNLIPTGGTNMLEAIELARKELQGSNKAKRTMLVITDGQTYDSDSVLKEALACKMEGIEIICLGVDDAKEEFIKELASRVGLGLLVSGEQLKLTMGEMASKL